VVIDRFRAGFAGFAAPRQQWLRYRAYLSLTQTNIRCNRLVTQLCWAVGSQGSPKFAQSSKLTIDFSVPEINLSFSRQIGPYPQTISMKWNVCPLFSSISYSR
jgi:hypothetical protein